MTTRTLVILRHAKAANPDGIADSERPLTDRGHADAAAAGAWLTQKYSPDLVICSPARRTRETWHGVALGLAVAPEVSYERSVYAAGLDDLVSMIQAVDPGVGTLLLVGHNPAVSQLSLLLDPDGADPEGLRTAGIAVHSLATWAACGPDGAALVEAHTARA